MKTRLFTTLLAVLLLLVTACGNTPVPVTRAVATVTPSLVRLDMPLDTDDHGGFGFCTGFVISPGHIMTDFHCVSRSAGVVIVDETELADAIVVDPLQDLAVIWASTGTKPAVRFRHTSIADDTEVYALGYGLGFSRPMSTINTVLWQHYGPDDKPVGLFLRGQLMHGMSGGPIFDQDGKVIGIAQQTYENVSYGQDAPHIEAFIQEAELEYAAAIKK